MDLSEVWKRHQNAPFPASALGLSVDGQKLVRLDAEVGAALTASLRTDGLPRPLSGARQTALREGLRQIRKALGESPLEPEAREYFLRLEALTQAVLAVRE
jgi:hypothetical protein